MPWSSKSPQMYVSLHVFLFIALSGFQLSAIVNPKLSPNTRIKWPPQACMPYLFSGSTYLLAWYQLSLVVSLSWWETHIQNIKYLFLNLAVSVHYSQTSAHFSVLCPYFLDAWLWRIKQSTETVITFFKPRLIRDLNLNSEKRDILEKGRMIFSCHRSLGIIREPNKHTSNLFAHKR